MDTLSLQFCIALILMSLLWFFGVFIFHDFDTCFSCYGYIFACQ
ncbi:putative membrane protein [Synechococcus sp. SYN20]|nr:putative membrane protein [Synechococcus sp. SYN20]